MKTSPGARALLSVPTVILSLLLILPNSGKRRTLEYRHSYHGVAVNFKMKLACGPQGDKAFKSCLWGGRCGGFTTVDKVRLNNSILGLNSIDFPVKCNKRLKIFQDHMCESLCQLIFSEM